ncbi:winged helix-turn-helix domain-containing protein [Halegenticoccus tardaugens]|uniref:winged helix-turn-helix domain-containing protein n=1 Tax=Halegenticoccus tardaugens TaxID=2071624 RepID=UPI00100AB294|nr:helix-turn-helix domain-containing protein [Halegenticoccus tardaugens]
MSHPAKGTTAEPPEATGLSPAEAFALLGNDTRIEILQALLDAGGDERPIPFSDLYERVDIDDSAHFNYHLKKLTDHFVRRTDEGYEFQYPGRKVVRSVFAGMFTDSARLEPFEAPGSCYDCGGSLFAWYLDEHLTIECEACGATHVNYSFPPGGLDDRTPGELLQAFHHHVRHHYCLAADGVCPECMGKVETTVSRTAESSDLDVAVVHECTRCRNRLHSSVGLNLLDNAEVLTFHAERGVDLSTRPFWTFDWCVSDERTTILSEEPMRVRLDIPCGDDAMCIVLDDDLDVVDVDGCARPIEADGAGGADRARETGGADDD